MDPSQGESQGKSVTSKLKAKVKGVKGKVHLPGHKKRQGGDGQAAEAGDSSDFSSDDSPKKPGPETGYNVGASTPFTTVNATPQSEARGEEETPSPRDAHNVGSRPSHTTRDAYNHGSRPGSHMVGDTRQYPAGTRSTHGGPVVDESLLYSAGVHSTSATDSGETKMVEDAPQPTSTKRSGGVLNSLKDTVGGAAAAVGSTVGFYTEVDRTPVTPPPRDPNAPSVMDKAKASLGMDKPADPNAPTMMEKTKATLGMDKPRDPNAPTMIEKTKATLGMDKPRDPYAPTMMEKTKATLGMDKPRDPNAPTMMEKTKAALGMGTGSPSSETSQPSQPGLVDRVSGAISSLLVSSPKENKAGEDVQHTFPAQSDYVRPAATGPQQFYGDRRGDARMGATPAGDHSQPTNRY